MLGWEFPPYFAGGVGVVCHALTKALARRHVQVTYVMPKGPHDVSAEHCNLVVADNQVANDRVRVHTIQSGLAAYTDFAQYEERYQGFLMKHNNAHALYGDNLLEEIDRFKEKMLLMVREHLFDFDVIHAHDWTTFPAAVAVHELTGKPLVVHVHITEFDKTGGEHADPRVYAIEKAGMDAAQKVIAVSGFIRNRCVHQYHVDPRKIKVVYNAVEQGNEIPYKIEKDDKVVLFLGRITLQKGPDYFIEAAKKVLDMDSRVKFIMAGKGDMLPRMIERAAQLGIGRRMIFPGFVNRQEAEQLFRMADVFVMPSVSEPFGIVPLEALAQGTPVIISRQSGVSEVLHHALKVDFWDVNDIANKILAALSYRVLHSELRSQGSVEVRGFNWDTAATQVEEAYGEVLTW